MRIGIAGYGRMGAPMAARMMAAGHAVVVWNRSAAPGQQALAAGATLAATPAALVQATDIVLSSLFDEAAIRAVYAGPAGLLSAPLDGRLLIDTSTVRPELGPELAAAARAQGGRFVDCPVLGSIGAAAEGRLIALAGGAPADMRDAQPVLATFARAIHALGASGAGYAGKLSVNVLKAVYWAALGDCMGLAKRYGISTDTILDVVESGPGASLDLPFKLPVLRGQPAAPAFDVRGCLKDLQLIVQAAGGAGALPVADGALVSVDRAIQGGWADRDVATLALYPASLIHPPEGSP